MFRPALQNQSGESVQASVSQEPPVNFCGNGNTAVNRMAGDMAILKVNTLRSAFRKFDETLVLCDAQSQWQRWWEQECSSSTKIWEEWTMFDTHEYMNCGHHYWVAKCACETVFVWQHENAPSEKAGNCILLHHN